MGYFEQNQAIPDQKDAYYKNPGYNFMNDKLHCNLTLLPIGEFQNYYFLLILKFFFYKIGKSQVIVRLMILALWHTIDQMTKKERMHIFGRTQKLPQQLNISAL